MKKLLMILIMVLAALPLVSAAEFYTVYEFSYSHDTPDSIYIQGAECVDNSCTDVTDRFIEMYNGDDFETCWDAFVAGGSEADFLTCADNARISGNIINTADMSLVAIKENTTAPFGYTKQFFASNDEYLPYEFRTFNYDCDFDTCVDDVIRTVDFNKLDYAAPEIQQVNIVNIDNPLLPVQVEVPVEVEETVCSAFRFTDPNLFMFDAPVGYSDFSSNIDVTMEVFNQDTSEVILDQGITIPIEADTCAGLAAFSWTPPTSMQGDTIDFTLMAEVDDNQVVVGDFDTHIVTEVLYPENLDGACYTRAFDFTLSNTPGTDLDVSVAQVMQGETLFASFNGGAYRDEAVTPMDYRAEIFFDGQLVYSAVLPSQTTLTTQTVDLTGEILNLDPDYYFVELVTTPVASDCTTIESVSQIQELNLRELETFDVEFIVRDSDGDFLQGADVSMELLNALDFFAQDPTYNIVQSTDANGGTTFTGAYAGTYEYSVSAAGQTTVTNQVFVNSGTTVFVTLPDGNTAPIVSLPEERTSHFTIPIQIDLRNHVSDFNDAFEDLDIVVAVDVNSGADTNALYDASTGMITLTTTGVSEGDILVDVTDPAGALGFDTMDFNFINNQAPQVIQFVAEPTNGEVPFNTRFQIDIFDPDGDTLQCTLDFDDGTSTVDNCDNLDNIPHLFNAIGTYNVVLEVRDGINEPVVAVEQVFVFDRSDDFPIINDFTIDSTNGNLIPTNLTLNWDITHPGSVPTTCTLRVNGANTPVDCSDSFEIQNFSVLGTSVFTIIALDDNGNQVLRSLDREFFSSGLGPVVTSFDLASSNGSFVPTDLTLSWTAVHPENAPINCSLDINGAVEAVACNGFRNIADFNLTGESIFVLTAEDDDNVRASRTITREFFLAPDADLEAIDAQLETPNIITPGPFSFELSTEEVVPQRNIFIKPTIICDGAEINLKEPASGFLAQSAFSRRDSDVTSFRINSDTADYEALVPTNTQCTFRVELADSLGSPMLVISNAVSFGYAERESQEPSIRGKGTDIANYMLSALGGIRKGYNTIDFRVENNEDHAKELTITMTSSELGYKFELEEELGRGEDDQLFVQVPIYLPLDLEPGLYPIRIAVYDETDKQVRYSYIKVD